MRFKGLDLNLLVALDALLDECSVSRAAERMHVSQPAMSASLGRLRTYFDDPLLKVDGKRMIPTSQALQLKSQISTILDDVELMVAATGDFDPARSIRHFRIVASDYIILVAFADLMRRLAGVAPGISFEFFPPFDTIGQLLSQGVIDLMIIPEDHVLPDHPAELLFEERHVVAGWRGNPLFARGMTADAFMAAGHVVVRIGQQNRMSFAEAHLARLGISRKVEAIVSSFSVVPELLVNTNRLALMHERLAARLARSLPLVSSPPPFAFPVMREMVQYHRTRTTDPGLLWLLQQLRQNVAAPPALP